MTGTPAAEPVTLDTESEERIAQRIAELLAPLLAPDDPDPGPERGQLLSANEVSEWWQIDRRWIYEHSDELGAIRLGAGPRPRLRFDADRITERLGTRPQTTRTTTPRARRGRDMRRSAAMCADSQDRLPIRGHSKLTSTRPYTRRPGDADTPPAVAPKSNPPTR